MKIVLGWPDPRLNPNNAKGVHWGAMSKMRSAEREGAYWRTKTEMAKTDQAELLEFASATSIAVDITFMAPSRRPRDLDNLLAAMKPALDGVAQAIGVDDRVFDRIILNRGYGAGIGKVVVEIVPIDRCRVKEAA